jgi:hypothetical protein
MTGQQMAVPCTSPSVHDPSEPAEQCVSMSAVSSHPSEHGDALHILGSSDPPSRRSLDSSLSRSYTARSLVQGPGAARINDEGGRLRVAKAITAVAEYIGTASPDRFDDSSFQHGDASDFPEIPGEKQRNRELQRIRLSYNQAREDDIDEGQSTRIPRSRAVSFSGSVTSRHTTDFRATRHRTTSPQRTSIAPDANMRDDSALQHVRTYDPLSSPQYYGKTLEIPSIPSNPTLRTLASQSRTVVIPDLRSPKIVVSDSEQQSTT